MSDIIIINSQISGTAGSIHLGASQMTVAQYHTESKAIFLQLLRRTLHLPFPHLNQFTYLHSDQLESAPGADFINRQEEHPRSYTRIRCSRQPVSGCAHNALLSSCHVLQWWPPFISFPSFNKLWSWLIYLVPMHYKSWPRFIFINTGCHISFSAIMDLEVCRSNKYCET